MENLKEICDLAELEVDGRLILDIIAEHERKCEEWTYLTECWDH